MELTKWDVERIEIICNGNKNAGRIVKTKTGLIGRTYNHEGFINGKLIVHTLNGKLLCDPNTVEINGFID